MSHHEKTIDFGFGLICILIATELVAVKPGGGDMLFPGLFHHRHNSHAYLQG